MRCALSCVLRVERVGASTKHDARRRRSSPVAQVHDIRSYVLYYNVTRGRPPLRQDDFVLHWKQALDAAMIKLRWQGNGSWGAAPDASSDGQPPVRSRNSPPPQLQVDSTAFPRAPPRVYGYDVVAVDGGVWLYLPAMITFFVLLTEIVSEREARLRLGASAPGVRAGLANEGGCYCGGFSRRRFLTLPRGAPLARSIGAASGPPRGLASCGGLRTESLRIASRHRVTRAVPLRARVVGREFAAVDRNDHPSPAPSKPSVAWEHARLRTGCRGRRTPLQ